MKISAADIRSAASSLKVGDKILLTGYIYTARDAAHKRLIEIIGDGRLLPFSLENAIIYYAGPTETPLNMPIGSCGPTTSCRMDKFTPTLLDRGVAATIGKGERSDEVIASMRRNNAVYFAALGGAGALAAEHIKSAEVVAFPDLGCESVKRLYVEDFPLIVAVDKKGNDIYKEGRKKYARIG